MQFQSKEEFQTEALRLLKKNNYTGVIVAMTGSSKSKVAIDAIKEGGFKSVLITSPRTNLKQSWKDELEKWHIYQWEDDEWDIQCGPRINITLENIQTVYKWDKELHNFDLIIVDEVHSVGKEYYSFIEKFIELGSIIALTATPDKSNEFKKEVLYKTLPILIEYHNAEDDGLVNKVNYIVYEHYLTDDSKVLVKTKNKEWFQGEKSRYDYIESIFESSKKEIEDYYFNSIKHKIKSLDVPHVRESYKRFFNKISSKDLEYFRKIYWQGMKAKKLPFDLYKYLRDIAGSDYAKFGMKADYYANMAPKELKPLFYKYIWARNERKDFLWNLTSTAEIAMRMKKKILSWEQEVHNALTNAQMNLCCDITGLPELKEKYCPNKVLLFSELTTQASKLSANVIHSNVGDTAKQTQILNEETLRKFNSGEIRDVASVKSLTLGLNLVGANYAIFESYSGSDVQGTQKRGRLNRLKVDDFATMIAILVKNTQMESWYEKAFPFIKNPRIIKSVDEL